MARSRPIKLARSGVDLPVDAATQTRTTHGTAQRSYNQRKKIAKYGVASAAVDMRGRHGNHARGEKNPRWTGGAELAQARRAAYQQSVDSSRRALVNARRRQRRQERLAEIRAIERAGRTRHREKKRLRDAAYRLAKPAVWRASIAKAKAKKPDLYRDHAAASAGRRRARLKAAPIEKVSMSAVVRRDHERCHLCGGATQPKDRTLDHLIPVARGGAWAVWNLMLAHRRCNGARGTRPLFDPETRDSCEAYIAAKLNTPSRAVA